jgi:hypothetical protein
MVGSLVADNWLGSNRASPNNTTWCTGEDLGFTVCGLCFAHCDISLTGNKSLRPLGHENTPNALGSGVFSTYWRGGLVGVLKHWRPHDSDGKRLL